MRDWPDLHAALLDMKEGRIEELEKEFGKDRVKFFKTDVTDYQSVQDSFKGTLDWRGGFSALIAAAGYATAISIVGMDGKLLLLHVGRCDECSFARRFEVIE
jgi:NADP-dependent 3-hydroxy acid dehydrogenase YdfG